MEEVKRKSTLMQLQASLPVQILVSVLVMAALIGIVYRFAVPNPNMILIAGLVLCSALFGYGGGVTAAVIMFFYTLFFFSTDHSFTQFTETNLQKVWVSLAGILADMLLVCSLKRAELRAFREVQGLTHALQQENTRLQDISMTDGLTGIRNRLALRVDYEAYQRNKEVTVMMLDLDNFKSINDTLGHETGDQVLRETGKLLADTFGKEICYRYGGDEFLVISPDLTQEEFQERLRAVREKRPWLERNGERFQVGYSIGYISGRLEDHSSLRELFSQADQRMYEAKRNK